MTTELTKAAQQALETLKRIDHADSGRDFLSVLESDDLGSAITAIERTLTQRPAAQTEREAFERWATNDGAWPYNIARSVESPDEYAINEIQQAWLAVQATTSRASLPTQPAAQATPEPVKFSHAGHFYNLVAHALMEVKRPDACAHRLRLILDELAVLMGQSATSPQQAAGEPVGEVSAESILNQWMAECGVYLVEKMGHQWASQTKQADLLYLVEKAISYTHPAPGVPEGFALVPVEPTQEMIDALNSSVSLPNCYRAMLAAAQAKGGE